MLDTPKIGLTIKLAAYRLGAFAASDVARMSNTLLLKWLRTAGEPLRQLFKRRC